MHKSKTDPSGIEAGQYNLVKEGDDEAVNAHPVYLFAPDKKKFVDGNGGWFIQWQETTMLLARNKDLTLTDWRVIAVLQAKLDFDNYVRLSQREIGREIDVAQPNVAASMKRLIGLDVILPGPSTRGVRTYRLNPKMLFKGTLRNAVKQRREAPQLTVVQGGKTGEKASGKMKDSRQPELLPVE